MTKKAHFLDWDYEKSLCSDHNHSCVGDHSCIGVDEAGRGPLAGPVIAAALILPPHYERFPIVLKDSKMLSIKQRKESYCWLRKNAQVALGAASVKEIDQINILWASMLAMERAVRKLKSPQSTILIDGNHLPPSFEGRAKAIVKGDQRCPSIAAASIVAKVVRDKLMLRLDHYHPEYGFASHKGYPTKAHKAALAKFGPCSQHRLSFKLK